VYAAGDLEVWRRDPAHKNISRAGDDRSPGWTWATYLYNDGEHIAMPSENIMVALRQAGAQMILKKQKTFKEVTQSGLLMDTEFCEFTTGGKQIPIKNIAGMKEKPFEEQAAGVEKLGFRLFVKRAKVGMSKHIRVRPRFDDWQVRGSIQILKPEITFDILEQLFELAGSVGLCDWRPGCKTPGPYGMFTAELN
jgi:hypothetical protein